MFVHAKEYVLYVVNDMPNQAHLELFGMQHQIPPGEKYRYASDSCFLDKKVNLE